MKTAYIALLFSLVISSNAQAGPSALDALKASNPTLYGLYQAYPGHRHALERYADTQGFRNPVERLGTVIHELVHIDSLTHQGFFVDGVYYEPYVRRDAWPALSNKDLVGVLPDSEKGAIFRLYVMNAPGNHLGNVIDEINAYDHVLPFVCQYEPSSTEKQVSNLVQFLTLAEGYLRTLHATQPANYQQFAQSREARGATVLIIQRARAALQKCGFLLPAAAHPETNSLLLSPLPG